MADLNSDIIGNNQASPPVKNPVYLNGGRTRRKIGTYTHDGNQSNGDVVRYFRVKSSDVIHSLLFSGGTAAGMTDANFGLWGIDGGAVVSASLFDDAQSLAVALTKQEKRYGADSALGLSSFGKTVWELLSLTEDPGLEYDVAIELIAAGSASPASVLEMVYTSGD